MAVSAVISLRRATATCVRDLRIYYAAERLHFAPAGAGATSNGVVGHRWGSAPSGSRFCTEVVTTADRASPVRVPDNTDGALGDSGRISCARLSEHSKLRGMSSVNEIEEAVSRLTPAELDAFRTWFAEFDASAWDRQMEEDVSAGRLDALADEALEDLRAGRCTDR